MLRSENKLKRMSPDELGRLLLDPRVLMTIEDTLDIIKYGANLDIQDGSGNTPLQIAVQHGVLEACRALVAAGASLDLKDKMGFTALHWAAKKDRLEICRVLVEAGAKVRIGDNMGWHPLFWANVTSPQVARYLEVL